MKIAELNSTIAALYLMRRDKRVPKRSKILISIAIGYILSPIDLIPDFIPFLGQIDDLLIVPALVGMALRSIPKKVFEEYKSKAQQVQLTKRFGKITLVIIAVWVVVIVWLVRVVLKFIQHTV
ncbi:YkvA family protein [Thermotoga profunda]|uniref:YkvA family protein n=1 Tax=Thermotoga profunda TaxID=1508420 RepID=UPI0005975394|nr:YkvA family protein [Thermotoga profunda]